MTVEELNARIGLTICEIDDISVITNECTKLSIEFTISILKEIAYNESEIETADLIWNKIKELENL